MFKIKKLFSKT